MTPSHAPMAAVRMMQRAGVDPAIIGDLIEEYSKGRSSLWFWMQAVGALVTKAPRLSQYVAAVRWLAALPLAILAARLVNQIAVLLFLRNVSDLRIRVPVAFFLMAAAFIVTGVAVAPGRKGAVARIAFAVVLVCSASPLALSLFAGDRSLAIPVIVGLCGTAGGVAAYRLSGTRNPEPGTQNQEPNLRKT